MKTTAYQLRGHRTRLPKRLWKLAIGLVAVLVIASLVTWRLYDMNLRPLSSSTAAQHVTVVTGSTVNDIADQLFKAKLIRSTWAFKWYVSSQNDRDKLQAGTYNVSPSQSIQQIVSMLTQGKVATDIVTILPGKRIDEVREAFIQAGFKPADVDAAFQAAQYRTTYPALADNPASANLEGFLFPDTHQKIATTDPKQIVEEALTEMQAHLTPDIRNAFASEGLSTYQGVTLASIVEQEVSKPADRAQAAQVFLTRLHQGMMLGSDVTANYGAVIAGHAPALDYDSPYNTLLHAGLPSGPISTVSDSSLQAVAHPATTSWLYFVTGDDGTTYFSSNLADHQALTQKYCHKLCGQ